MVLEITDKDGVHRIRAEHVSRIQFSKQNIRIAWKDSRTAPAVFKSGEISVRG